MRCSFDQYIGNRHEIKKNLEKNPALRPFFSEILKKNCYPESDFDNLFRQINLDTLGSLIQQVRIKSYSISNILRYFTLDILQEVLQVLLLNFKTLKRLNKDLGIEFSNISSMLSKTKRDELYVLQETLKVLELESNLAILNSLNSLGITFSSISSMLTQTSHNTPHALQETLKVLGADSNLATLKKLKDLDIKFPNISSMLSGAKSATPYALQETLKVLELESNLAILNSLKGLGIIFSNISNILSRTGRKTPHTLQETLKVLGLESNFTTLKKLKDLDIMFSNVSGILSSSGYQGPYALQKILKVLGLESNLITLKKLKDLDIIFSNISSMLYRCGSNAPHTLQKTLKVLGAESNLATLKKLKDLGIKLSNIFYTLSCAGTNAPDALEKNFKVLEVSVLEKLTTWKIYGSYIFNYELLSAGVTTPDAFAEFVNKKINLYHNSKEIHVNNNHDNGMNETLQVLTNTLYNQAQPIDKSQKKNSEELLNQTTNKKVMQVETTVTLLDHNYSCNTTAPILMHSPLYHQNVILTDIQETNDDLNILEDHDVNYILQHHDDINQLVEKLPGNNIEDLLS
ncbi:hypothetical protein [Orientia tsutsugamushi]|uniref:Repeat-containing protein D n=1 Tax=Orientia tsutsugamushi (strain Boryong) TaxID=357244 RepID=A5CBY9_ORITB|nr:hypothetical protein [Orientia tsutsugamushi]CAM79113.1 hypothetical protein OTBS_0047 [Orientia tsutsugamushi str. Boryong]